MLIQDTDQHKYTNVFLKIKYHLAWIFEICENSTSTLPCFELSQSWKNKFQIISKILNLKLIKNVSKSNMLKICVRRSGSLGEIIFALQIRFKITGWKIHFWANDFSSHVWKFYKLEKLNHSKCSSKAKFWAHQSRALISKEGTFDNYFRTEILWSHRKKNHKIIFLKHASRIHKKLINVQLRSWKAWRFSIASVLLTVRPIVTCGSRVSRAPPHHTLPDFLNLHGSKN